MSIKQWFKLSPPRDLEKSINDPLEIFNLAQNLFYQKNFKRAEKYIDLYRSKIDYEKFYRWDQREQNSAYVSVVVVTYNAGEKLLNCLQSLSHQNYQDFEMIVVDNGKNSEIGEQLKKLPIFYIRTPQNLLLSEGRNIGVHFSRGDLIAFLDDDATVNTDYIDSIVGAFQKYNIHALRGKVLPQSQSQNEDISHYDMGDTPFPSIINTEGNSAFLKQTYLDFLGMNPLLFGHEGWELSSKIIKKYGYSATLYWPKTVIYHDFSSDPEKIITKNNRHALMTTYIKKRIPGAKKIRKQMKKFYKNDQAKIKASSRLILKNNNYN